MLREVPLSATSTVQVRYRHHELAAAASISELSESTTRVGGTHRLELDDPPPVRTVLAITGDGRTRAFEVREVVEVASEGATRGCVLAEVALDRLPLAVGTEDREAGVLGAAPADAEVAPVADAGDDEGDGYGAHMAVPAPVVNDEDDASEPVDVGDDGGDGGDDDGGNGDAPVAADDGNAAPDGGAGGRAKKRRGRQRR